jgi:phosphomannomutase
MINWCPIGRNANHAQRQEFVELDKSISPTMRKREIGKITHKVNLRCKNKVVVKLGGETSFDIYPEGWDKTYALKHFSDYTCWFVGDRCSEDGNDKEIYDELLKDRRAFATTGTSKTALIINKIIEEIKND